VTSKSKNKLYEVTDQGEVWLQAIGIDDSYRRGRRDFARACLDWSERGHHLAGEVRIVVAKPISGAEVDS